ncbi:hypothetical protein GA0115245_11525 [Streptomyces sp. di188]|nr:hypothetical protein GA0115238_12365 [Streptomyces sp. di50b]SCD86598.1 hypothetical protein GA0115245_11525 [Streptomyces sp. di188]
MRDVTYAMGISLDGYITGPDGGLDWSAPDPEVFRFWIDETRGLGVHLLGRRLYEPVYMRRRVRRRPRTRRALSP